MTYALNLTAIFKRAGALTTLAMLPLAGCKSHDNKAADDKTVITDLCLDACPTGAPTYDDVLRRPVYTLSFNNHTKFADWVAYEITPQTIGCDRKRNWHHNLLPDETLAPGDYKGISALKADRGHQAPLDSLGCSPDWEDLNDMANITPQSSALNRGPWEALEKRERKIIEDRMASIVYSVTGVLYEHAMPQLPNTNIGHTVPSGYWKVVAIREGDEISTAAFIYDQNTSGHENFCVGAVTVEDIEKRANLKIFPLLEGAARESLEMKSGTLLPQLGCAP